MKNYILLTLNKPWLKELFIGLLRYGEFTVSQHRIMDLETYEKLGLITYKMLPSSFQIFSYFVDEDRVRIHLTVLGYKCDLIDDCWLRIPLDDG